jgi:hypothetical protein
MPSLKGLACVSLFALAITAPPVLAQSITTAPSAPTMMPGNPSTAPADQQSGQQKRKHRRRSRGTSAPQGQTNSAPSDRR